MSISTTDYATLSEALYGPLVEGNSVQGPGANYVVLKTYQDPSGYYGAVLQNTQTRELVVAFRGTESDDLLHDAVEADCQTLIIGVNQQLDGARHLMDMAVELSKHAGEDGGPVSISVTGHSLGGTLAQVMSYEYNVSGATFNAYGAAGLFGVPADGGVSLGHNTIVDYMRATDAVVLVHQQYGEVEKFATADDVAFTLAGVGTGPEGVADDIIESAGIAWVYSSKGVERGAWMPHEAWLY